MRIIMKITGNEPATPTTIKVEMITEQAIENMEGRTRWEKLPEMVDVNYSGLSIRQHFAALAMQAGITADPDRKPEYIANDAVLYADALIAELNKEA